ncbi:MAG: Gfo/Idh/MocA family protein [Alphaproteobacteria bacterium]
MSAIKYGVIGAGMMGQEHIRYINLLPDCRVSAIADPNLEMREQAKAIASEKGAVKDYENADDLFQHPDQFDLLLIAAPNFLHAAIMRQALSLNKPILVEKPLATSAQDCLELMKRAESCAAPIWVAMEYRYMSATAALLEALEAKQIGDHPIMISIKEHRYPFLDKIEQWNRFNAQSGGTMVEKSCHFFDLMRLIARSDPARIYASIGQDVNHVGEVYKGQVSDIADNGFVIIEFENGVRGNLDLCMFGEGAFWQERISVTGQKGELEALIPAPPRFSSSDMPHHSELIYSDRKTQTQTRTMFDMDETLSALGDHHGSTLEQHRRFLDLITGRKTGKPEVGLEDGYWAVRMGEAAQESAKHNRLISFKDF